MRVALVGAEFEENLAVRYLWGALEHAGHEVRPIVFNAAADTERAAQAVASSGAALAGFSMVFTYRAREFARLATRARELGYRGHLIAGGHFAAFHAEELLADVPAFDSAAIGEGEELLVDLIARLGAGDDLGGVRGLVWRRGGAIVRNEPAIKPPDLDVLPPPPRKAPFDEYLGLPITNMLGSRGCTHACSFCSIAAWHHLCGGDRLRLRAPDQIADEMADLYRQGVRIFNFHDDNFFLDRAEETMARARALHAALERRGVGRIAFAVKSRPDTVDEELFAWLKEMGLFRVFLGIEAGTARSLKRLGRGQSLDDNLRALEIVNRLDIHTCFNLLLLDPDSTLTDLAAHVAFLRANARNPMNFCRTEIYAGTPLEKKLRLQGRLIGDYWGYDYQIADPLAQAAFDVIHPVFLNRNYGRPGVHHRVMDVDYEHQILTHFHGGTDELRRRVKRFIVEVNHNTCDHLDRVIAATAAGRAERDRAALVAELHALIAVDDARLLAIGDELIADIQRAAREPRQSDRGWVRTAAAAGLVASMSLAAAGCKPNPGYSHATETIARPIEPPDAGWPDAATPKKAVPAPAPPRDGSLGTLPPWRDDRTLTDVSTPPTGEKKPAPPLAASDVLRPQFNREVLAFLAREIPRGQPIDVELWLDKSGRVTRVILGRATLAPAVADKVKRKLGDLRFRQKEVQGKRVIFVVTPEDLDGVRVPPTPSPSPTPPPPDTFPSEMAPEPPHSHRYEMAAPRMPPPEKVTPQKGDKKGDK